MERDVGSNAGIVGSKKPHVEKEEYFPVIHDEAGYKGVVKQGYQAVGVQ